MDPQQKEQIAQEKFGTSFEELSANQKKAVGGQFRANELGHEGYSEMGKKGGSTTKDDTEGRTEGSE